MSLNDSHTTNKTCNREAPPQAMLEEPIVLPVSSGSLLDRLLVECVQEEASDLHIAPNLAPYYRIHGHLAPLEDETLKLSGNDVELLARELAQRGGRPELGSCGSLDGAMTAIDGTRFRFNIFRRQGQIAIALRRLEERFRTLSELGLSDHLYSLCDLPDGLVVVAGPTGAGKSTTLAAMLDRINQSRRCHMVTIEDPIEYLHTPAKSLVNQRQVGADTDSFSDAVVAAMRQDPDVILVGEIRDLNTIRTAITAAETGHLVFTTVHAGDCVGTIERLVSVFPADEQFGIRRQLSLVMRSIIAQQLLICDGAKYSTDVRPGMGMPKPDSETPAAPPIRRRRIVTSEVLLVNPAVANLIATGKSSQIYSAMESGGHLGMQTYEEDLARLWSGGYISEATATTMARNPGVMRDRYNALRTTNGIVRTRGEFR